MASVKLEQLIQKLKLINLTPDIDVSSIRITQPDVNRPALQMAGYFEHLIFPACSWSDLWNIRIWRGFPRSASARFMMS